MADPRERTPEEREAARLERERRRQGLFNSDVDHEPAVPEPARSSPSGGAFAFDLAPPADHEQPSEEMRAFQPRTGEHRPVDELSDEDSAEQPGSGEPAQPAAAALEDEGPADLDDDGPMEPVAWSKDDEPPAGTRRVSRTGRGVRELPQRGRRRAGGTTQAPRPPRRPGRGSGGGGHRREHSWLGRFAALVILAVVAVIVFFAVKVFQPFGTSPHGQVTVVVPAHASTRQIGDLLAKDGVVASGFYFEVRATLAGQRGQLRAGTYHLQQGMSYGAVLTALTAKPKAAKTTSLTIAEGHTRQYVAALLHRQHVGTGNYLALTRSSKILKPQAYGAPKSVHTLEGFLFPDTFSLVEPIKLSALVDDQLTDFKRRLAGVNLSYARSKNLTAYDVLKIASMIEAEAASQKDRALIASVIYNRLHDGMMLQFDSTTRYATGNFTGPLTVSQLHSSSPYNTHTHLGLPPTPINSPGLAAINAAAHPAHTNYLFFFTKPCNEGGSVYTHTYSQFQHLLAVDKRTHCPG